MYTLFVHDYIYRWFYFRQSVELDIRLKMIWIDYRLIQNNTHPGSNTTPYDDLSIEAKRAKRRTINNPDVMATIWKPNIFIGMC